MKTWTAAQCQHLLDVARENRFYALFATAI
jgi:hypothetical protein